MYVFQEFSALYSHQAPDVVPVGFDFDGQYFYVVGIDILKSRKYKNVLKNNKVALVIGLTIILEFGVATGICTGLPSSPMKLTNCTSKVLELAQKGIVREVGGYYGAIYECSHMHGLSSVYGEASS